MTKVLLLEDENDKAKRISAVIRDGLDDDPDVVRVADFAQFCAALGTTRFDLVVLDLMVPYREGGDTMDVTDEVVGIIRTSETNSKATYVAITQFNELAAARAREFAGLGIAVVEFSDEEHWIPALKVTVQRAYRYQEHDFVIICALPLERTVLQNTSADIGDLFTRDGLNCQTLQIGDYRGVAILLHRMGLVEASISTAKAIETFRPRLVTTIGICAAFEGRAELGSILFGNPVWEHQTGKWLGREFTVETYQEAIPDHVATLINQEIERTNHFDVLKKDLIDINGPEFFRPDARVGAMVSGSAVIASKDLQGSIASQHKRLVGLDMEMFGVYRAASKASERIDFFGVKVAVDLANEEKENRYQRPGALVSARVATYLIPLVLKHSLRRT